MSLKVVNVGAAKEAVDRCIRVFDEEIHSLMMPGPMPVSGFEHLTARLKQLRTSLRTDVEISAFGLTRVTLEDSFRTLVRIKHSVGRILNELDHIGNLEPELTQVLNFLHRTPEFAEKLLDLRDKIPSPKKQAFITGQSLGILAPDVAFVDFDSDFTCFSELGLLDVDHLARGSVCFTWMGELVVNELKKLGRPPEPQAHESAPSLSYGNSPWHANEVTDRIRNLRSPDPAISDELVVIAMRETYTSLPPDQRLEFLRGVGCRGRPSGYLVPRLCGLIGFEKNEGCKIAILKILENADCRNETEMLRIIHGCLEDLDSRQGSKALKRQVLITRQKVVSLAISAQDTGE